MKRVTILLAALILAPSVNAKTQFAALETREPTVITGNGGTRVTKYGIDYWTSGSPPRRHQVIGMIEDNREIPWLDGSAVGSKAIAKQVKKAGGDAVVFLDRVDHAIGVLSGDQANPTGSAQGSCYGYQCYGRLTGRATGAGWPSGAAGVATTMIVVKYLPAEQ